MTANINNLNYPFLIIGGETVRKLGLEDQKSGESVYNKGSQKTNQSTSAMVRIESLLSEKLAEYAWKKRLQNEAEIQFDHQRESVKLEYSNKF